MEKVKLVKNKDYSLENGVLKIFEGVRHIPSFAFSCNKDIQSIILPSTLISIGVSAFSFCENLTGTIIIPDFVKYILGSSFNNCKINKIKLGKNVIYIGGSAFENNMLTEIENHSDKIKLINYHAFLNNKEFNKFILNNYNVYTIDPFKDTKIGYNWDDWAKMCNLNHENEVLKNTKICTADTPDKYTFEDGILKINDGVEVLGSFEYFKDCTSIEMPDSVVIIMDRAFEGLTKLENIKFSNNLLYLGSWAFSKCSLKKHTIRLPESLSSFSFFSFYGNQGDNKIQLSNRLGNDPDDDYEFVECDYSQLIDSKDTINFIELVESQREKLSTIGLLPETICDNKKLNKVIPLKQSLILKQSLVKILIDESYDEKISIQIIKKILESREIDISDIHDVVDHLFVKKQIETIYLLISYGYDFANNCMISKAIINDMPDMVDILLMLGTKINETGNIAMTPLSIACQKGDYITAKLLIESGAAINMIDACGKKSMDYVIENNNIEIINLLKEYYSEEMSEVEKDLIALTKGVK